ncbi:C-type lectin domain family 4 member E-like isoform X2 [Oculina patagonica]
MLVMRCKRVLLFFLFQTPAVFFSKENTNVSRSSYFTTLENKQLKGYVVKRFDSSSLLSCSQQCIRNEWCTSTNYKMSSKKDEKGTCELNKHDISLVNENTNFHDQQGVTFSMFLKGCVISGCLNGGSCLLDKHKQTFSCSCQPPWTGETCEVKMAWIRHGNSCYHVNDTPTLSWSDARTTCQNLGGELAIIRSADENEFILDLLRKQQTVQFWGAWIGLYRKADTKFYWIDDTPLEGQYSAWASGEPNKAEEKCVQIYAGSYSPGKWNDNCCNLSESKLTKAPVVLCQKKYI